MELWIRSQDKTILSKAQNIIIRENQNENNETNYAIVDIYTMGIYKTKERALEVLDEIQKLIQPVMLFKNCECDKKTLDEIKKIGACIVHDNARVEQINQTILYEMPKD